MAVNEDSGAYQHDLIQASLLYEWKIQSKAAVEDGYYGIYVTQLEKQVNMNQASSSRQRGSGSRPSSRDRDRDRDNDDIRHRHEEVPDAAEPPQPPPLQPPQEPPPPPQPQPLRLRLPSLATFSLGFALALLFAFALYATACHLAAITTRRHHEERAATSGVYTASSLSPHTPLCCAAMVELPPRLRPADYEALDRIAMMLPSKWIDWLQKPPYIASAWPTRCYSSNAHSNPHTHSLRAAHDKLNALVLSNSVYHLNTSILFDRLRYANGWTRHHIPGHDNVDVDADVDLDVDGDGIDEHLTVGFDSALGLMPPAWLRDAAHCWGTRPRLFCRLRQHGTSDPIAHVRATLLDPWDTFLAHELSYLRQAHHLLHRVATLSAHQLNDTLSSLHHTLAEYTRTHIPFPPPFSPRSNAPPPADSSSQSHVQLAAHYQHFAHVAFTELLSVALQPEFEARIRRLEHFQQQLHTQRQNLAQNTPDIAIPAFYRQVVDWIANDAAYALRTTSFTDASTMRHTACTWTLKRLPLLRSRPKPPEHESCNVSSHTSPSATAAAAAAAVCLDRVRDARVNHYNTLAQTLWLSPGGQPSVRWHWNEGGSWSWVWEARAAMEWRSYVERKVKATIEEIESSKTAGRSDVVGGGGEDESLLLPPLPSRGDGAEIQRSWPKLTERAACKERHLMAEVEDESNGGAKNMML